MDDLRLIIDPPRDGPMNMAIDEVLLKSAANGGVATLRLYQWSEPTLSLGYFQPAAERETHQPSLHCPLVRRASGGGAILHHRELTYSLALPEASLSANSSRLLYEKVHASLISLLDELGVSAALFGAGAPCETAQHGNGQEPFLCFERRTCFDIVSSGVKIVGSAQRRRRGGVLQHGSILLSRSDYAPELPGIEQISCKTVNTARLIEVWPPQLAGCLAYSLTPGVLCPVELSTAELASRQRFTANEWLHRR